MSFAAIIERLEKGESPYPGLRPFDVSESHLFFGRDPQVAEIVRRLERHRLVAVLGVSGSGKSSLVRAGLIPALERGGVWEAGHRWRRVITQPGGAPFESLAADLASAGLSSSKLRESSHGLIETVALLPPGETLLLVVDQFEELFRYKDLEAISPEARQIRDQQAADAAEFVQLLLESTRHHPPIYIILTMRSDYVGDCAAFRDLPETLNDCQYLVPRMTRAQRKEAIEAPLGRVRISSALVQRLLNDVGDEPDLLPVMQHALMRTWNQWRTSDPEGKRPIEIKDYDDVGGFEKALNRHADELLGSVPRDVAACIFKRLTARSSTSRERRNPTTLNTLWNVCGANTEERREQVVAVIDTFRAGQATFLRPRQGTLTPDTYVDITHESLIRLWETLRDTWLPAEQQSAKMLIEVAERAANMEAGGGELLTGKDLARVEEWDRSRNKSPEWASHYVDARTLSGATEYVTKSRRRERSRILRKRLQWSTVALLIGVSAAAWGWQRLDRIREASQRELVSVQKKAEDERAQVVRSLQAAQTELVQQEDRPVTVNGRVVAASDLQPRVYIQVRNTAEAARVLNLTGPLQTAGYLVPKPQVLKTGPTASEVRYFRSGEKPLAERLTAITADEGYFDVRPVYVAGFEQSESIRRNHFELWLAPDDLPALAQHLSDPWPDVRKAAGRRLARGYLDKGGAIAAVLDLLSSKKQLLLTTDGRINALYFLNATQDAAWTDELRRSAKEVAQRIRSNGGAALGEQTASELAKLGLRTLMEGQGFMGGTDYRDAQVVSAAACSALCASESACVAMTFLTDKKTCYLKNALTQLVPASGMVSAAKK